VKYSRFLGFVVAAISLSAYVIFAISIYTLQSSFAVLASAEGEKPPIRMNMDINPSTGAATLTFLADVRNEGFLDLFALLKLKLLSEDRRVIAEGSDSGQVSLRSTDVLMVKMTLSREDAEKYLSGTAKAILYVLLEYRTFFNLIGIAISLEMATVG